VDLRYRGPAPDWSRLPSVDVVEATDGRCRLRVDRNADLGAVLAAVGGDAEVLSFAYQPPTLSDLFHQAVAA
jgi:ABC-2 type transport system ATP-binding protein